MPLFLGTAVGNYLTGTSLDDTMHGGGGSDTVNGYDGNDLLYGHGTDPSVGVDDNAADYLYGGGGNDTLFGGGGADDLRGGSGNNVLNGGDGDDRFYVEGNDSVNGGAGTNDGLQFSFYYATAGITVNLTNLWTGGTGTIGTGTVTAVETMLTSSSYGSLFNDSITIGAGLTAAFYFSAYDGNDSVGGGSGGDFIYGGTGNDTLNGFAGNDTLWGEVGNDSLLGGLGNDELRGGLGSNTLDGGDGNDTLVVSGNDVVTGGIGTDGLRFDYYYATAGITANLTNNWTGGIGTLGTGTVTAVETMTTSSSYGSFFADSVTIGAGLTSNVTFSTYDGNDYLGNGSGNDTSYGGTGNDTLEGFAGNDALWGEADNDSLNGGAGNDELRGGLGSNTLNGGDGDDTLVVSGNDSVTGGLGADGLRLDFYYATTGFTVNLTNLWTGGTGVIGTGTVFGVEAMSTSSSYGSNFADNVTFGVGLATSAVFSAYDGNDSVTGGSGADFIYGGNGNDTLSGVLGADGLYGDAGDDVLTGGDGQNTLNGGVGNDRVNTSSGNDSILGGVGTDLLNFDYRTLTAGITINFTTLWTGGSIAIGTRTAVEMEGLVGINYGSAFADSFTLGATFTGGSTVYAGAGNDTINGSAGIDALYGEAGNDQLIGGAGNDILNGGLGVDAMTGGLGNDTYYVDAATDTTIEAVGGGTDTVRAMVNHTLALNVETLFLDGGITGTGNALANAITGNAAANALSGLDGNDSLIGGAGNDTLTGGLGSDAMTGGLGNDVYYVDVATDTTVEAAAGGTDTTYATLTYTLAIEVENLVLVAGANGTGNASANSITGNAGNNLLTGLAGNDSLIGGAGNDTLDGGLGNDVMTGGLGNDQYLVGQATDNVVEAAAGGTDLVRSTINYTLGANVENLTLLGTALTGTGNTLNNAIIGTASANTLMGLAGNDNLNGASGNDTLNGGLGLDTLTGGLGLDVFVYTSVADAPAAIVKDTITDFNIADDLINLSAIDADSVLIGNQAFTFIGAAAFTAAGQVRYVAGLLELNVDATLTADMQISLTGAPVLTAGDFVL